MGAPIDRGDEYRPFEHRPHPNDQAQLAPTARREYCGFSISGESISNSRRTAGSEGLRGSAMSQIDVNVDRVRTIMGVGMAIITIAIAVAVPVAAAVPVAV